ncbi:MAG: class I SAM-dependent methyltransferase [Candidatus Doudnabacteria bacterium]|nr:class I SAM-dependent methyltransferase [Candidatus Doudnabacteria bacterium]
MTNGNWKVWNKNEEYGQLLYRRAIGEEAEMESAKALCEILKPFYKSGMTVLDVGCGAGHYLRSLRMRLDPKVNYTGVDATEKYVALARQAFPEARFIVGDIFALPFRDREFDIVMCNNVLYHLPPPPGKPLSELTRVAKKHAVIRTVFGERNYIIRELPYEGEIIHADGEIPSFNFFNMYTEDYYRKVLSQAAPDWKIEIIPDTFWKDFDVRQEIDNPTATHIVDGKQVSGNLILDFRFIVLERK